MPQRSDAPTSNTENISTVKSCRTAPRDMRTTWSWSAGEALGVVVVMLPFNYPAELTLQKVAPALLMGNAVIMKASDNSTAVREEAGRPGT